MKHHSSDEELKSIVEKSSCIRQVLNALGMKAAGGNYKTVKRIAKLGLGTTHFTGSAWNRGRHSSAQRPLEVYLSNQAFITSHKLKNRLIADVKQHCCDCCGLSERMNKPIPLELSTMATTKTTVLSTQSALSQLSCAYLKLSR